MLGGSFRVSHRDPTIPFLESEANPERVPCPTTTKTP